MYEYLSRRQDSDFNIDPQESTWEEFLINLRCTENVFCTFSESIIWNDSCEFGAEQDTNQRHTDALADSDSSRTDQDPCIRFQPTSVLNSHHIHDNDGIIKEEIGRAHV